jgi:hypothetical protein
MTDLGDIAAALGRLGYDAAPAVHADDELELQLSGDEPGQTRATAVRLTAPSRPAAVPLHLLMLSTSYPFGATKENLSDVRLAAAECTQYLVLGHFEVDDDGSLHLRYSTLVDDAAPPADAVLEQIVGLLDFQQQHFGDYLERICSGAITIDLFPDLVANGEASGLE